MNKAKDPRYDVILLHFLLMEYLLLLYQAQFLLFFQVRLGFYTLNKS